jgi:hypothetical protein
MTKWLKKFYASLPIIRELQNLHQLRSLQPLPRHIRFTETNMLIQTLEMLKMGNERYRDPRRLMLHGAQYWSQSLEDGMIAEIFRRIGSSSQLFLEIGVGDGRENNTTALLAAGWKGWWIEGDRQQFDSLAKQLEEMPAVAARLKPCQALVSPDNIAGLFEKLGIPSEVDLFSLDIDLDTFHLWVALDKFRPRVVVVEYNAGLPAELDWVHPYKAGNVWDGSQAFGASLKAFERLGRQHGYSLVGCDITGANAFFVRNDLVADKFAAPFTAENHYEPPRYYMMTRMGDPFTIG